jgi:hypothetical protein
MRSQSQPVGHGRAVAAGASAGVVLLLALGPTARATPFVTETADAGFVAGAVSLQLDRDGEPHISYIRADNFGIYYARRSRGEWTIEAVDTTVAGSDPTSLELDAGGHPHVAFYSFPGNDLKYASRSTGAWVIETVDSANDVGGYLSLALDGSGAPRISYFDDTNGDLKYARKSGGVWTIEIVDSVGFVGQYTSLALDANGDPRISYRDASNSDLKFASKSGATWTLETVDAVGSVGVSTSLALDALGNARISYHDATNSRLKYASQSVGGWTLEIVDANGGIRTSLALDVQGNPRIGYQDVTNLDLKYAVRTTGWAIETLDSNHNVGNSISLALDRQGNPCIAYDDATQLDLKFTDAAVHLLSPAGGEHWATGSRQTVRWSGSGSVSIQISADGGASYVTLLTSITSNTVAITVPALATEHARMRISRASFASTSDSPGYFTVGPDVTSPWWTKAVDTGGDVGEFTSLELDAHGAPHIAYHAVTSSDLKYARKSGAAWSFETVDATGDVGEYASLALDAQGNPRIGYYDASLDDLEYASKSAGIWTRETVDATGNVGQYISLALDAAGNPRLSYYDNTLDDLKYASKSGATWTLETVDAVGNVGLYTSLALDSRGNPHISYHDTGLDDLKYASKSGATWTLETVDSAGNVGQYTSLALDAYGNPHIGYYAPNGFRLKYATKIAGTWSVETVETGGFVGGHISLALDSQGNPHMTYYHPEGDLELASKSAGVWTVQTVDNALDVGEFTSLALDAQGNPRVSYFDHIRDDLKYASAAIELGEPAPDVNWPVGAARTVTWDGTGRVDLYLSVDGGGSWQLLQSRLAGGEHPLQVPHAPTRFAKLKLERALPYSVALTDLFTVETSIALLNFTAEVAAAGEAGAVLAWNTDPAPADLRGYRLERAAPGSAEFSVLVALTRETTVRDPQASAGSRYRLFAVNGLGAELLLGETALLPRRALDAWPRPYRGGALHVSFAAAAGLGGGPGKVEIGVYDVRGRLVRSIVRGLFPAGFHAATWDGRDERGLEVAAGIYFLRAQAGGEISQLKVVRVR